MQNLLYSKDIDIDTGWAIDILSNKKPTENETRESIELEEN